MESGRFHFMKQLCYESYVSLTLEMRMHFPRGTDSCFSSLKPIYFGNGIKKHHLQVIDSEKERQLMK